MVYVYDNKNPKMESSTAVLIKVRRNEYAPVFNPKSYAATVSEHAPLGQNITVVTATDDDVVVSSLSSRKPFCLID